MIKEQYEYYILFAWGQSGRGVKLTTHLHVVSRLRMDATIPPLPQYVFMAWCLARYRDNSALCAELVLYCDVLLSWFAAAASWRAPEIFSFSFCWWSRSNEAYRLSVRCSLCSQSPRAWADYCSCTPPPRPTVISCSRLYMGAWRGKHTWRLLLIHSQVSIAVFAASSALSLRCSKSSLQTTVSARYRH
jgi:hypothetical protein